MNALILRTRELIDVCWRSFCAKVGSGVISINKEASMQLQFAYLLKNTLDLAIQEKDERIEVELETSLQIKGNFRECDIVIQIAKGDENSFLPIELKCFKTNTSSGGKRGGSDNFMKAVYKDIELVESYASLPSFLDGMCFVMTDLKRFVHPTSKNGKKWDYDTSHGTSIVNGRKFTTSTAGDNNPLTLKGSYTFHWERVNNYYFLKLEGNKNQWIYATNEGNTARYTLGKKGNRNLICIGINPSTAEPENLDNTLKKVESVSLQKGYDGWLMLNLYPQRDKLPENIHSKLDIEIVKQNNIEISKILSEGNYNDVWAAWGTTIETRPFLSDCLVELRKNFDESYNWLNFGEVTKNGHPRHPLYVAYKEEFYSFDIDSYIISLKK